MMAKCRRPLANSAPKEVKQPYPMSIDKSIVYYFTVMLNHYLPRLVMAAPVIPELDRLI